MPSSLSSQEFVDKWCEATLKERPAAHQHFLGLCQLVGHELPALADPIGKEFTFEKETGCWLMTGTPRSAPSAEVAGTMESLSLSVPSEATETRVVLPPPW